MSGISVFAERHRALLLVAGPATILIALYWLSSTFIYSRDFGENQSLRNDLYFLPIYSFLIGLIVTYFFYFYSKRQIRQISFTDPHSPFSLSVKNLYSIILMNTIISVSYLGYTAWADFRYCKEYEQLWYAAAAQGITLLPGCSGTFNWLIFLIYVIVLTSFNGLIFRRFVEKLLRKEAE